MPFLETFIEGLTSDMKRKAQVELGETEEIRAKSLQKMKYFIKEETDFFPCTNDTFLLRFLRARKFNVERSLNLLKNYYKFKARYSGSITDFKPSDFKHILKEGHTFIPEYRDHNDVGIGVIRIGKYDVGKFTAEEIFAFVLCLFEMSLETEATQILGIVLIDDCTDISLSMVKHYASASLFYKVISAVQNCLPLRIKAVHVVNEPSYYSILVKIAQLFMSEKMKKRLHFHGSDLRSFHQHVPREILPQELGGLGGPSSKLADSLTEKFLSYEDYFIRMNQFGYRGKALERIQQKSFIWFQ